MPEVGSPERREQVALHPAPPDLSVPIVYPERDCGGIEQQQELVLEHLLFEALNGSALSLVGLLQGTRHGCFPSYKNFTSRSAALSTTFSCVLIGFLLAVFHEVLISRA